VETFQESSVLVSLLDGWWLHGLWPNILAQPSADYASENMYGSYGQCGLNVPTGMKNKVVARESFSLQSMHGPGMSFNPS
jgi:hypothetical protein